MHKKTFTHIGLIFILFGFISLTSVAQANIIPDPSFERGTAKWQLGDYASSIVSAPTRTGSKALKLINDFNGTKAPSHNAGQYRINGVVGDREYVYTVWVKGNNVTGIGAGGKPLVVVRWRNAAQQTIREEMYNWAPYGTYNWREMKLHMQAPSAATGVDVSFRSWWDCTGGQTYWDDVSLAPRDFGSRGSLLATYQAENANTRSGGSVKSTYPDYTGSGYFDVTSDGAILQWNNVAGGGDRVVAARYSWEGNVRYLELYVNGVSKGRKQPVGTGRRGSWASELWNVNLPAGSNTVRLKIGNAGGEKAQPMIDRLAVWGLFNNGGTCGFVDVPLGYWAEDAICTIYEEGITTGCSKNPLKYCPQDYVTRAQMAIFLGRGIHGSGFTPPPATGIFDDVPVSYQAAAWIEQFYKDGITTGCNKNPLEYCPDAYVSRAQMAIFLLRSKHGKNYTPPKATGIFSDVPVTYWGADWVEQLYNEGITTGCQKNPLLYCPESSVTRDQMAVFIMRTFGF